MKPILRTKKNKESMTNKVKVRRITILASKKGITLVALVITIIVLLILATVAINMAIDAEGIFGKATTAKEEHRAGVVKENVALWESIKEVMKLEGEEYATRDEMMWDLYKKGLLTKLELNRGKYKQQIQIASQTIDFGEDNGVKKIAVMENPPKITYLGSYNDEAGKLLSDNELNTIYGVIEGTVNPVFTSNDSILEVEGSEILYGKNCIDKGTHSGNNSKYGAFSIEFATNSKEIIFNTEYPMRIFVDEGNGYECTNLEGLNKEMLEIRRTDGIWKLSFSEEKDRNIKFEISRYSKFDKIWINKDADIKKVSNTNGKKAMFLVDINVIATMQTTSGLESSIFLSYPFEVCDSLNLSCIMSSTASGDLYVGDCTFKESLENAKQLQFNPDIVVFAGGVLLGTGANIEEVKKAAADCYQYAKENFPTAKKIIVIGNDYRENYDAEAKEINKALRETALANNCYYIDLCTGETISALRRNYIKRKGLLYNRNGKV